MFVCFFFPQENPDVHLGRILDFFFLMCFWSALLSQNCNAHQMGRSTSIWKWLRQIMDRQLRKDLGKQTEKKLWFCILGKILWFQFIDKFPYFKLGIPLQSCSLTVACQCKSCIAWRLVHNMCLHFMKLGPAACIHKNVVQTHAHRDIIKYGDGKLRPREGEWWLSTSVTELCSPTLYLNWQTPS